jgi:ElaB/YqjD/DUF883 family membrane-anchored ribosome-binding protein
MKNNQDTAHTPKELLHELQTLVTEAETMLADALPENSSEAFGKLSARCDAARERFNVAKERLAEFYQETKKRVAVGAKYTDTAIRENPYQSLAIALGAGVLLGVLIGRRSK